MATDERGLELTTSDAGAAAFDDTLRHALEYRADTPDRLALMFEADPDFVMGHCLKGLMLLGFQSSRMHGDIADCLARAEAGLDRVTARERANVAALRAMHDGDRAKACAIWEDLLAQHPTDLMALRHFTFALFWSGRSTALRDAPARVIHAWDDTIPGYGDVLGMYSFGLEETADYARAEALGRQAVAINRNDLWAVHAVAHVLEMQGRLDDGIAWMTESGPDWADRNPFKSHLWWHLALYHLERGEFARVFKLYDLGVREKGSEFYIEIQNAGALLWRLEFLGVDVGGRWDELADSCEARIGDIGLGFTATHDMMALAMAGRDDAANRLLESLRDYARRNDDPTTATMDSVTLPLCEAVLAYGRKDYARAHELLRACGPEIQRNGASHAQRDVYSQALIESAIRSGDAVGARALLSARLEAKPHGCGGWQKYAATLGVLGDSAGAAAAQKRAREYAA